MTKTLADYTPDERREMIGMWCDCEDIYAPCVLADTDGRDAVLLAEDFNGRPVLDPYDTRCVTPRFDLPRAWAPSGEPVPGEWQYHPAYTGVYQDGTTSLNLIGVETYSKQDAEWECADIHRDDPAVRFFPVRRYVTDWEEA